VIGKTVVTEDEDWGLLDLGVRSGINASSDVMI
jgi:hypothetical protein